MTVNLNDPSRDELLAELLAELVERSRLSTSPDIAQVAQRHPELADELRQLWATVLITEDVASFAELPAEARGDNPVASLPQLNPPKPLQKIGDYELLAEIGRGGMGIVYTARQLSLGRIVAVKTMVRGQLASASDVVRFKAEAESAARLDHPHIVPIYEVGEHEGQPWFSMKYVAGTTLATRLAEGPLPPREAAALLLPVCRAIAEAHQRGVLHRDLKPANILIDVDGQPHVSDFGLAKRIHAAESVGDLHHITQSGAIVGTPGYMPPEQAAGQRGTVGPASDVYSLGAILYHALTGRAPFQAASPVDVLLMVLEQEPLPPRLLNPSADRDLEMICLKCLQKPAELRYATAEALADDLAAYLANEPISARSTNLGQLMGRMLRETHHAGVLENWGLLWMWHSLALLVLCLLTNWMKLRGINTPQPYLGLWVFGLGTWIVIFWALRRRAGPITFVERQIAHVWAGSVIASTALYVVEMLLGLPVLALSPVLGLTSGMVFLAKAGILSGTFYLQAAALFLTAIIMALWPDYGLSVFGIVSALCFFVPGFKYHRQSRRESRV